MKSGSVDGPVKYVGFAPAAIPGEEILKQTGRENSRGENELQLSENLSFSYLKYSGEEIRAVSELVTGSKRGPAQHYLSGQAKKQTFKRISKENTIIHLSTHSLIDEDNPELSGLLFYPEDSLSGEKKDASGLLLMNEIFALNLNANLLILSACATGTGKVSPSEGTLAVTRGFYFAGASNILYTLSKVSDRHAKDFTISFFTKVLSGQSYSTALRNTKLELIGRPETSLPKIWSEYLLLGR
jgi:CHAT domain-containing protein